jgi:hypothetical protein
MPLLENGLMVLAKGYAWLPDKRRALGRRTVPTRLGGMPAVGLEGPEAARFLYDENHVLRSHALPEPVQATLFGKGAVHSLDGEAHRLRKAMFVALLMREDGIASLVQRTAAAWDDAAAVWATRPEIVLFDEAAEVIAGAVTRWAGVQVTDDEVPGLARDLVALVDSFATGAPGTSAPGGPGSGARRGSPSWSSRCETAPRRSTRAQPSRSSRSTGTPVGSCWNRGWPRSSCSTSSGRRRRWPGSSRTRRTH